MKLAELPQQFLRALVERSRQYQAYFDNQVTGSTVSGRRHAALIHAESLTRLRPGRYSKAGRAFQGGHLDLGAQRGFVCRDRDNHVEIVALSTKQRMRVHVNNDDQLAGRAAPQACIPATRHVDVRAVRGTGRNDDGGGLAPGFNPRPTAGAAWRDTQIAGPAATSAGLGKHHVATDRSKRPLSLTSRARLGRGVPCTRAVTFGAARATRHGHRVLHSGSGILEPHGDWDMKIGATHGVGRVAGGVPAEHLSEQIAEGRRG